MKPTGRGRLCTACEKEIIDFSNKSWSEIVAMHQAEPGVCGLYTDRQLKHWGPVPQKPLRNACPSVMALVAMWLAVTSAEGQVTPADPIKVKPDQAGQLFRVPDSIPAIPDQRVSSRRDTSIRGHVTDEAGEDLIFANVLLKKDGLVLRGATTDFEGNFKLDSIALETLPALELEVQYIGYRSQTFALKDFEPEVRLELQLLEQAEVIAFGVRAPLRKRIWWRLTGWLRSKN
ncbi:MAG: carboxypeptidase-like regulatory domain-containing protein [Phaeodactylibacter sp.]|nr:carboxypeptidase-like regulatory domain-containing protein [Phaeodactylibacter sp.]